ncbi:exported hypothetical protein [Gammaproteobacteria bacterium]
MNKPRRLFLLLVTVVVPTVVADNNMRLQDGTPIFIDETSRGVYVLEGNIRRPLWGGVHRLENGSSLTVNGGILINEFHAVNENTPRHGPPGAPSRCEVLVTQVCGSEDKCATHRGCQSARQLLEMEKNERPPGDPPSLITPSSDSCIEALRDIAYFVPCSK